MRIRIELYTTPVLQFLKVSIPSSLLQFKDLPKYFIKFYQECFYVRNAIFVCLFFFSWCHYVIINRSLIVALKVVYVMSK